MRDWADDLLREYKMTRKQLRQAVSALNDENAKDKEDKRVINSSIRDIDFSIEWMDIGIMPEQEKKTRFVYGVDGYWDDSLGSYVHVSAYSDPFKAVEDKIDKEIEVKRIAEASNSY